MATINEQPKNENKPVEPSLTNQKLKKGAPINLVLVFLILGLAVYGVFLNFDKGNVLSRTNEIEEETRDIETQVESIRANKVEVSQNASDALAMIEKEEVRWSEVIEDVDQLLPQSASGQKLVNVLSYSGSGQGRIALNMVTQPKAIPPFEDVARLIATFNSSVFFKDAYVPSISKSSDETGEVTLSFVLNMDYEKPETGSESFTTLDSTTLDGEKVPVSKVTESTDESAPAVLPDAPDSTKIPRNN